MNKWLRVSLIRAVFLFGFLPAQTWAADGVLTQAMDQGYQEARAKLNVDEEDKSNPESVTTQIAHIPVPVVSDKLQPAMQQYAKRVVSGMWGFYTSAWWQVTIRVLVTLCALIGIGYHIIQIGRGEANPGSAWISVFVKVSIAIVVHIAIAPNIPFVLTRAINAMTSTFSFDLGEKDTVKYHQQAFLRRALFIQGRALMVLNGRLGEQYYPDQTLPYGTMNRPDSGSMDAPEEFYPSVTAHGKTLRTITPMAFVFIGPPKLGDEFLFPKSGEGSPTEKRYLVAPPAVGEPSEAVRSIYSWLPGNLLPFTAAATDNGYALPDPLVPGKELFVQKRPFAAGVEVALREYQAVYNRWTELKTQGKHHEALANVDALALQILNQSSAILAHDIVDNQAFALTPKMSETQTTNMYVPGVGVQVGSNPSNTATTSRLQAWTLFYNGMAQELSKEFAAIKKDRINSWTYDYVIPFGLLFCNAYMILCIWLLPVLLPLWAAFFLLPPLFESSTALKRGGAVVIALVLYPVLLQLILVYCFALADAATTLDNTLDPQRGYAQLAIYGMLPSSGSGSAAVQVASGAGKYVTVNNLADAFKQSNAGMGTMIAWIIILLVLVGSPAIIAKFIMGMGAADALSQPVQSGATMGTAMGSRALLGGVSGAAGDVSGGVSAVSSSLSRRMSR